MSLRIGILLLVAWSEASEVWIQTVSDRFDSQLSAVCAEPDPGRRPALVTAELTASGLTQEQILALAERSLPPDGPQRPGHQVPWPMPDSTCTSFSLLLPPGYDPVHPWPMVVLLNLPGQRTEALLGSLGTRCARAGWIVLAPALGGFTAGERAQDWTDDLPRNAVLDLVAWTVRQYRIDARRLALVGGEGAWILARAEPRLWQAVVLADVVPVRLPSDQPERYAGLALRAGTDPRRDLRRAGEMRKAVEDWKTFAVQGDFAEDEGEVAATVAAWLDARAPRAASPLPMLLAAKPFWADWSDPLSYSSDPAMDLITGGQSAKAVSMLSDRLRAKPSRRDHVLRAYAHLPALLDPLPGQGGNFPAAKWQIAAEDAALSDLDRAVRLAPDPSPALVATAFRLAATIHARRTLALLPAGGTAWEVPHQAYVSALRTAFLHRPDDPAIAALNALVTPRLPPPKKSKP